MPTDKDSGYAWSFFYGGSEDGSGTGPGRVPDEDRVVDMINTAIEKAVKPMIQEAIQAERHRIAKKMDEAWSDSSYINWQTFQDILEEGMDGTVEPT